MAAHGDLVRTNKQNCGYILGLMLALRLAGCGAAQTTVEIPKPQAGMQVKTRFVGGGHVTQVLAGDKVVISHGKLHGLVGEAKDLAVFGVRKRLGDNANTELDADVRLARARVVELRPREAVLQLSAQATAVEVGDYVEHTIDVPAGLEDDPVFELAALDIGFRPLERDVAIYDLSEALQTATPAGRTLILQKMVAEVKAQAQLASQVFGERVEGGRFHGLQLGEAFDRTTADDMGEFLLFVRVFPGKYIAHRWKLVEVYATWIINRTPSGDTSLAERRAAVHSVQGNKLAAAGDFSGAELEWRQALVAAPSDSKVKGKLKDLQDIRLWQAALQRDPDDTATRWKLLVTLFRREALDLCSVQLDALGKRHYKPDEVLRYRAMILSRREKYAQAAEMLRDVQKMTGAKTPSAWLRYCEEMARLQADPSSYQASMALAKVHEDEKNWGDALEKYQLAQDRGRTDAEVRAAWQGQVRIGKLRELDKLAGWVDDDIAKHAVTTAQKRIERVAATCAELGDARLLPKLLTRFAEAAYNAFDERLARKLRLRQIDLNPGDTEAWLALGWLELRGGDLETAKQAVQQALTLDSGRDYGHQILARVALLQGDWPQVERECRLAMRDVGYGWPRMTLARALVAQQRWDEAVELAEAAWKLLPDEGEIQNQRSAVLEARDAGREIAAGKGPERARLRLVRALVDLDLPTAIEDELGKFAKGSSTGIAAREAVLASTSREMPLQLVAKVAQELGGTDELAVRRREWVLARYGLQQHPDQPEARLRAAKAMAQHGEFHRALATLGEAKPGTAEADLVELARRGNDAEVLVADGEEALQRSDPQTGGVLLARARVLFESIESQRAFAVIRLQAFALVGQARHREALELLQKTLPAARRTQEADVVVPLELKLADVQSFLGNLAARREALERVRQQCADMDRVYCQANMLIELGDQAMTDGTLKKAQELVEAGLKLAERTGILRVVRSGRGTLADVHLVAGNLAEVKRISEALLIDARKEKDFNNERMALMLLGAAAMRLGDTATATLRFAEVYALGTRTGDNWVRAQARLFEGRAWLDAAHDAKQAEPLLAQATELYAKLGDGYNQARALQGLGEAHREQGQVEKARADLENALQLARTSQVTSLVTRVLAELAIVQVRLGRSQQAVELAAEATQAADKSDNVDERWQAHHAMAKALDVNKQPDVAFGEYERTVADLVQALSRVGSDDSERSGAMGYGRTRSAFEDAVEFCMRTGRVEKALEWLELSRDAALRKTFDSHKLQSKSESTQKTLDELKTAEQQAQAAQKALHEELAKPTEQRSQARVEALGKVAASNDRELRQLMLQLNAKNPRMYQALSIKAEDMRELQRSLPEGAIVVEYFVGDDALYIFVLAKDATRPRAFRVEVGAQELEQTVFAWRASVHAHNPQGAQRGKRAEVFGAESVPAPAVGASHALGQKLFRWLLGPIESELKLAKTAMIVPYGPLYYLPLHALEIPGDTPRYVIEQYRLGYLSAATRFRLADGERHLAKTLLAFANPDGTLPGARSEIERVQREAFPDAKVYFERDATKERFFEQADKFAVIHFATHGVLAADATASFLKMAGEPLTVFEISGMEGLYGKTDLVVLSACDTALQLGKSTGEELISVAAAFSMAGAPALVASLWEVDDEATSELMAQFYRLLKTGKGADGRPIDTLDALRDAQLHVMRLDQGGKQLFREPEFWAAFQLIGDYR